MKRGRNWFWGIFLLVAGIFVVVAQFTSFANFSFWNIALGVLLTAAFIQSLISRNWTAALLSLALSYLIFHDPLGLPHISPWLLILAAVLTGIGLSMIIHKPQKWHQYSHTQHLPPQGGWQAQDAGYAGEGAAGESYTAEGPQNGALKSDGNADDNHPCLTVSFGAASRYLHSTALEDGYFKSSFGAMEVYLDQARLGPNGATLTLEASFGAIKLYVPAHWNVQESITTSLGGVDNDSRRARPDLSLPPLRLVGSASFGAIEITYV